MTLVLLQGWAGPCSYGNRSKGSCCSYGFRRPVNVTIDSLSSSIHISHYFYFHFHSCSFSFVSLSTCSCWACLAVDMFLLGLPCCVSLCDIAWQHPRAASTLKLTTLQQTFDKSKMTRREAKVGGAGRGADVVIEQFVLMAKRGACRRVLVSKNDRSTAFLLN